MERGEYATYNDGENDWAQPIHVNTLPQMGPQGSERRAKEGDEDVFPGHGEVLIPFRFLCLKHVLLLGLESQTPFVGGKA